MSVRGGQDRSPKIDQSSKQSSKHEDLQILQAPRVDLQQHLTRLKLNGGLSRVPDEILSLYNTLQHLDLSGNPISELPHNFHRLHKLKIAFFSDCSFTTFPYQLGQCRSLEMVAFKNNSMSVIAADVFPRNLRWLILTNNKLTSVPQAIGECHRLQKCMLAGNHLTSLPDEMAKCQELRLLRISANDFNSFPPWLFTLPVLAFLSIGHNPCMPSHENKSASLLSVPWSQLQPDEVLGSGASGVIYRGGWASPDPPSLPRHDLCQESDSPSSVAIKLFHSHITSDGHPLSELLAYSTLRSHRDFPHANLIHPIRSVTDHPEGRHGLVMNLVSPFFTPLGSPPDFETCTRDVFPPTTSLLFEKAQHILKGIASAMAYLHDVDIIHGDLYAHNILMDDRGAPLLSDLGAATLLPQEFSWAVHMGKMEVLAFGHLIDDVLNLLKGADGSESEKEAEGLVVEGLSELHARCTSRRIMSRPGFVEISRMLEEIWVEP